MPFSKFLDGKRGELRALVQELGKSFPYVSVLGTDVRATLYRSDRNGDLARDGEGERGFVVKLHDGGAFYEYSLDDVSGDIPALAEHIVNAVRGGKEEELRCIQAPLPEDREHREDFLRETDFGEFDDRALLSTCRALVKEMMRLDSKVLNAIAVIQPFLVSKIFVSKKRELTQHYGWANGTLLAVYQDGKTVQARRSEGAALLKDVIALLKGGTAKVIDLARHLTRATPIEPGVYDVITDPSITGLIAHEAFGHGVEMDQFVKDRALAKQFVGQYVASPITNMRDGAAAALSVASYFFDDDGVPAQDTQIIRDGILVAGLSDLASASQLQTAPSGNGRRDSYKRKAYSRMTNTFFQSGKDTLVDMISSIEHGYMLFETNNGMEDPKNWQIQCTAEYGIEIVNGKLTDHYVSPVVMTGSVPELLKSISMVSDEMEISGSGFCGKGYKEWVRVSDGGPHLKVRVKLG